MSDVAATDDEAPRRNPYVGLRPFFKADSLYFFGRDSQTQELLAILGANRFLGVVGSSGSGKSSLVRAGLVPALLGGFLVQDRDRWRKVSIKPGDAPVANLATGLIEAMATETSAESAGAEAGSTAALALEADIRDGHAEAVIDYVRARLEPNANLFVLVDQFEEVFAFRGDDESDDLPDADPARKKERARRRAEASDFVDILLKIAEQRDLPIYVVLTMRTDFLGDCDLFYGLPEALNAGRYLVPRMTREQLRDGVECPALLVDAQVAPRLVDHVLNALGDRFDRLPVYQHALMRTFDAWLAEGSTGPVDQRHFEAAGGLEGALNQDAEKAMEGMDVAVVERIFKRLTDTDSSQRRIRSPARISELVTAAGAERAVVETVLTRFEGDGRSFVHATPDGRSEDPRVDISHESLIRQWTRLRDWVDAERKSRDTYVELVERAVRWRKDEATALQGPELRLARNWQEQAKPTAGWAARYARGDNDFALALRYVHHSLWRVRIGRVAAVSTVVGIALFLGISAYKLKTTVRTATEQNSAMVASVYRKLDPIAGTESARIDLLKRTIDLNIALTDGKLNESNQFWDEIVKGDGELEKANDKYFATVESGAGASAALKDFIKDAKPAVDSYRLAANRAAKMVEADPNVLSWYENLSTALIKISEGLDYKVAAPALDRAIDANKHLVAAGDNKTLDGYQLGLAKAYSARAEAEPDYNEIARHNYVAAIDIASTLLKKNPNNVEVMSVYIDAASSLWNMLGEPADADLDKRLTDEMLRLAQRRIDVDKKNKESWADEQRKLYELVGREPPKPVETKSKRGTKAQ